MGFKENVVVVLKTEKYSNVKMEMNPKKGRSQKYEEQLGSYLLAFWNYEVCTLAKRLEYKTCVDYLMSHLSKEWEIDRRYNVQNLSWVI